MTATIILLVLLFLVLGSLIFVFIFSQSTTEDMPDTERGVPDTNGSLVLPSAAPPITKSTSTGMPTATAQSGTEDATRPGTDGFSVLPSTAPPLTTGASSSMATTTTWIPMISKPIICSYRIQLAFQNIGTRPGVCDYIFMDSLYHPKYTATIFDIKHKGIEWLLEVSEYHSRKNKSKTEFGLFINYLEAAAANKHIKTSRGSAMVKSLWNSGIHHFGVQRVEMTLDLFPKGISGIVDIFELLKTIREVQRMYQSFPLSPAHIVVGIDLYEPRSGHLYASMLYQLRTFHVDGIIIRTHQGTDSFKKGDCYLTGPSVFEGSKNRYEVAIKDALTYVDGHRDVFRRSSLMISFSMDVWWYQRIAAYKPMHYGMECFSAHRDEIFSACKSYFDYESDLYRNPQHTRFVFLVVTEWGLSYDDPLTLSWKICEATKQFVYLKIGMALFNMESEDTQRKCYKRKYFSKAVGYWRAEGVSSYFRQTVNQSNFLQKNLPCPT